MQIAGEVGQSNPLVFWLTRRMCEQLVKALCQFIEKESAIPTGADKELMLSFRQSSAMVKKEIAEPVRADSDAKAVLLQKIDLTFRQGSVVLVFYVSDNDSAHLPLTVQNARQWLGIIFEQYQAASWPLDNWPAWAMEMPSKPVSAEQQKLLH